jgi:glucose-6-phosphate isomerase
MASGYTNRTLSARYPADLKAWQGMKAHYRDEMRKRELGELFRKDARRAERLALSAGDLVLDYSKNHVNARTLKLLNRLAKEAGVPAAIDAMFAGERINETEGRAVLHTALRSKIADQVGLETPGVVEIWETLTAIEEFVEAVHSGQFRGHTGKSFSDIVNIGIGGSDLGPVMASRALRPVKCRWHTARRSCIRAGPGEHVVRHLLEDVHDARDDDERDCGA